MTAVGNIGVGLLILIVLWIAALIAFVVSVRLESNFGWISIGTAVLITLVLILIPLEGSEKAAESFAPEEKDIGLIYKYVLLTFLIICTLALAGIFFLTHCIDPIRPHFQKSF